MSFVSEGMICRPTRTVVHDGGTWFVKSKKTTATRTNITTARPTLIFLSACKELPQIVIRLILSLSRSLRPTPCSAAI